MPHPRTVPLAAALAGVLGFGCLLHREPAPCIADRDCKLDRICDAGKCVWAAHSETGSAPSPSGMAGPGPALTPGQGGPAPGSPPVARVAPVVAGAMFRLGPEHRGRSPHRIPARRPEAVWAYETRGPVTS